MPIIYYDGNCVYCYNYAIWLIQNGLSSRYQFAKLQGATAQSMFANYPETQQHDSVILQEGDQFKYKSDAIASLISSLTNYKWIGLLLYLTPKFLRDFGYQLLRIIETECGKHIGTNLMIMSNHFLLTE